MDSLIIGAGEVGKSLGSVLGAVYSVGYKDLEPRDLPERVAVMHVCLRYSDDFLAVVKDYAKKCNPWIIDVCSTVPPGTTEKLGPTACHSTTRGLHPNLGESIKTFVKHIGGPKADELAGYYEKAGVKTLTHSNAKTTELAHILSNTLYGINLMAADEFQAICRNYGVDYTEAVLAYNKTSNEGYVKLGHPSKLRMLLTPPNGFIGGHCVRQGAALLPGDTRTPLVNQLANHGMKQ